MTLQQKYPIGHEVVCVKTYNSTGIDNGKLVDLNQIIFRGEHGVIVPCTVNGCITIEIMRHQVPCGKMLEDFYLNIDTDEYWRLVP